MKIYGIGGLGVDERVFSELSLNFKITVLPWIKPDTGESLSEYAKRFSERIDQSVPFIIVGISFGGMLAIELSKLLKPEQVILISSATQREEIPLIFRLIVRAGVLKQMPSFLMKPPPFVANWFFGVKEEKYKSVLQQIISETNTDFLRWALAEIGKWDNQHQPKSLSRIHGTADRLLKCYDSDAINIKKGGHFMIMDKAGEVSDILNQITIR